MYQVPEADREEERSAELRRVAGPYSLTEGLGIIKRNITGIDTSRNEANISCAPQDVPVTSSVESNLTVGFLGDIMNLGPKALRYGDQLGAYFAACDIVVGNFEATITNEKRRPHQWSGLPQPQAERVIEDLAALFPPERFWLSLANNHSGDYGRTIFDRSNEMLAAAGFRLFGLEGAPLGDVDPSVRIVTGTMWSNQLADDMVWLPEPNAARGLRRKGALNVLYPHWGYELEAYPRRTIVERARAYADSFDAVVGHHAHNPQPVEMVGSVPVFYGLGDFCYYYDLRNYRTGMVSRLHIATGADDGAAPAIARADWRYVESAHTKTEMTVEIVDDLPGWLRPSE